MNPKMDRVQEEKAVSLSHVPLSQAYGVELDKSSVSQDHGN